MNTTKQMQGMAIGPDSIRKNWTYSCNIHGSPGQLLIHCCIPAVEFDSAGAHGNEVDYYDDCDLHGDYF